MGAEFYFGFYALKLGHKVAARRMLLGTGAVIAFNLLFTFSVPNISMADHAGGLVTGFIAALALGVPRKVRDAWALSDRCPKGASFTYDVNAHVFSYHGPVEFARAAGLVEPTATAETKVAGWPPCIDVADLDPRTPIDTYVGNP